MSTNHKWKQTSRYNEWENGKVFITRTFACDCGALGTSSLWGHEADATEPAQFDISNKAGELALKHCKLQSAN